jgi:hypothetical protein
MLRHKTQHIKRAVQVGFVLAAILSVTLVLMSPDASDDVNGILHLSRHSQISPRIVVHELDSLIAGLRWSEADCAAEDLPLSQSLNRFCIRLC